MRGSRSSEDLYVWSKTADKALWLLHNGPFCIGSLSLRLVNGNRA